MGLAHVFLAAQQVAQVLRQAVQLVLGRVPLDGLHANRQRSSRGVALDVRSGSGNVGAIHAVLAAQRIGQRDDLRVSEGAFQMEHLNVAAHGVELDEALNIGVIAALRHHLVGVARHHDLPVG